MGRGLYGLHGHLWRGGRGGRGLGGRVQRGAEGCRGALPIPILFIVNLDFRFSVFCFL
jgi:hypothetical protein